MDTQLKTVLEMLGVDRPVVRIERLANGLVRVTLLGGDTFEVTLGAETGGTRKPVPVGTGQKRRAK